MRKKLNKLANKQFKNKKHGSNNVVVISALWSEYNAHHECSLYNDLRVRVCGPTRELNCAKIFS